MSLPHHWTPDLYISKESELQRCLEDAEFRKSIPSLNTAQLDKLKDQSLVRFTGMIQDMLDPEIFLEKYVVQKSSEVEIRDGRFRDIFHQKPFERIECDAAENVRGERRVLFMISIPGLNAWAEQEFINLYGTVNNVTVIPDQNDSCGKKRALSECEDEDMETDANENSKKLKSGDTHNDDTVANSCPLLSREYLLNSPIPERPSKACMVKIYSDFDALTLNSMIEVVGFLSVDPSLDGSNEEPNDFEDIQQIQATNPPPSLIPRLHVINMKTVTHSNPLFDESKVLSDPDPNIHKDLVLALTQCLFGDTLAAEYLLCHLISRVYVRTEMETLGQCSLNLSNIPSQIHPHYTAALYEIIEMLLPASHFLPMTIDNLNTMTFQPKKDYKTGRLVSGVLQLAPHTHLVLDETQMQSGKLESNGVQAIAHFNQLIRNQKLNYDFQYYPIEFETDIPVLILSEGACSMLPNDFLVPLRLEDDCTPIIMETVTAAKHFLTSKLNAIRIYLTQMRLRQFTMDPNNLEMVQNDFVAMRKEKGATVESLHSLLVLGRLLSLTQGETSVNESIWNKAKLMETERIARINLKKN